ncbi:unnamed protein product [Rotaria sordida]|uniref:Uncharacterized protein n=1 Tax=Rotaria sordida TaxID=392033 RepID=A0A815FL13_9BILA|nr:unnamed protein product [Rotaria sordida]CAF1587872.1 unnamed protein product [Rotaria sordida]
MAYTMHLSVDQYQQPIPSRQYQIREKIFFLDNNFKIKDEMSQDVYFVRSKISSFQYKFDLEDMTGNGIITIQQDFSHLHPTYNISSARQDDYDRQLGVVKQKFELFHKKFSIDSIYGQYSLESLDLSAHSFSLTKNERTVATVNKKYFSTSNTYGVEIAGDEDQAFILAIVIVLD